MRWSEKMQDAWRFPVFRVMAIYFGCPANTYNPLGNFLKYKGYHVLFPRPDIRVTIIGILNYTLFLSLLKRVLIWNPH